MSDGLKKSMASAKEKDIRITKLECSNVRGLRIKMESTIKQLDKLKNNVIL